MWMRQATLPVCSRTYSIDCKASMWIGAFLWLKVPLNPLTNLKSQILNLMVFMEQILVLTSSAFGLQGGMGDIELIAKKRIGLPENAADLLKV